MELGLVTVLNVLSSTTATLHGTVPSDEVHAADPPLKRLRMLCTQCGVYQTRDAPQANLAAHIMVWSALSRHF